MDNIIENILVNYQVTGKYIIEVVSIALFTDKQTEKNDKKH